MKFWLYLSILYPIGGSDKPYCPLRDTTYTLEIRISERLAVVDRVDNWRECAKICNGLFHPAHCTHWTYATENVDGNYYEKKRCDLLRFTEAIPDYHNYTEPGFISGDYCCILGTCWHSWFENYVKIHESNKTSWFNINNIAQPR